MSSRATASEWLSREIGRATAYGLSDSGTGPVIGVMVTREFGELLASTGLAAVRVALEGVEPRFGGLPVEVGAVPSGVPFFVVTSGALGSDLARWRLARAERLARLFIAWAGRPALAPRAVRLFALALAREVAGSDG